MANPFRLYISYPGYYPIPAVRDSCTRLPIPVNLTWTELTDSQILKNNLELSTGPDKDVSEIAIRTKLDGDFTIFGDDYDSLVYSLRTLNLNELVLRIDRYDGSIYSEYWRGTVEIRGSEDVSRKKVTLSKFTTIDDYTDFLRYKKTKTAKSISTGGGLSVKMEIQDGGLIEQLIYGQIDFSTNFQDASLAQYSRTMEPAAAWINYSSEAYPTFYNLHGLSDDTVNGKLLLFGTVGMTVDFAGNTDAEITISHQQIFDIYAKLFNASWYIGQPVHQQQPCFANSHIYLRRKIDVFTNDVEQSYIAESKDFKRFKYILPKLITHENHEFSEKNIDASHVNAAFTFNVNGDLEKDVSVSAVFTDLQRLYDAEAGAKEDDWLNDDDWVFGLGNQQVDGVSEWLYKEGTTQIGSTSNYDMSLAWRMENDINNFHQLDLATYNNAVRALNPDFAKLQIEQVPFPIGTTDIKSLNFYGITVTSLGNMRIIKAVVGFNEINAKIICVQ